MKTQKLKHRKPLKLTKLVILMMAILFAEILVIGSGSLESVKTVFESKGQKYTTTIYPSYLSTPITQNLGNLSSYQNLNLREKAIIREPGNNKVNSDKEFSIAKLKTYLNQDVDPVLRLIDVQSIAFPENEMMPVNEIVEIKNDKQLLELKAMANKKTNEAVKSFAFEKRLQEYLVAEKEKTLELEKWMTDENCWCPEMRETMNLAELK